MLNDDALTADDVAAMLQVAKNSIYKLAQTGELASYRVGRKLRFTRRDVEAYIAAQSSGRPRAAASAAEATLPHGEEARGAAATGAGSAHAAGARNFASPAQNVGTAGTSAFSLDARTPFVLAGNDVSGDILANHLNAAGVPVVRAYAGSYTALVNLYGRQADAALSHLYDRKTNAYNIAYVQRIAPGTPVVVIRLLKRRQGLIVAQGNPKKLTTWGSILRKGVRLANRERGCGTRILLDEKLLSLEAVPESIAGYERELPSGLEVARAVAQGLADVGVGAERAAQQVAGLEFAPLQTEWLDVVIAKTRRTEPLARAVRAIAASEAFRREIDALEGCKADCTGAIVYEC